MSQELHLIMVPGGAEIIGKGDFINGDTLCLEHPLVIRPMQQKDGSFMLDLFPHSLANPEGQHKFNRDVLISESVEIPEMLSKAYTTRTSAIILNGAVDEFEKLMLSK